MDSTAVSPYPHPKRGSKISKADVSAVAKLVAEKRFTIAEACGRLDLNAHSFHKWCSKEKNKGRFGDLIERVRGARLDQLIERIDDASLGKGMKQPDWRAAAWLAGVIDRQRYGNDSGQQPGPQSTAPTTNINVLVVMAQKMLGLTGEGASAAPAKQVSEPVEVKRIEQTNTQPSDEQPLEPLK